MLGKIRDGELVVTSQTVTLVLESLDRIKLLLAALEEKEVEVEDFLGPDEAFKVLREALDLYRKLRRGELGKL